MAKLTEQGFTLTKIFVRMAKSNSFENPAR